MVNYSEPAGAVCPPGGCVPEAAYGEGGYASGPVYNGGYGGPYGGYGGGAPVPEYAGGYGPGGVVYDEPQMPGYAWPSYASHPNYAALQYPKQYSPQGVALYRTVLSLSASAVGMAEGLLGMG